jgi:hypothetical protein
MTFEKAKQKLPKVEKPAVLVRRKAPRRFRNETPPRIREKLTEAAEGQFQPGDRSNVSKILATLR